MYVIRYRTERTAASGRRNVYVRHIDATSAAYCRSVADAQQFQTEQTAQQAIALVRAPLTFSVVSLTEAKERERRDRANTAARARHAAYTACGMTRTPYGYE